MASDSMSDAKSQLGSMIGRRVLLLDGAMGTMLRAAGFDCPCDRAMLARPELVADIHRRYLRAGADIVTTCTFRAQPAALRPYGLADSVDRINMAAAEIARREADRFGAFVAGSVGPADPSATDLRHEYLAQMRPLIRGGVDALLIETAYDLRSILTAVDAAHEAMAAEGRTVDLMLSLTIRPDGCIFSGETPEDIVEALRGRQLLTIGLNCIPCDAAMAAALRRLAATAPWPVSVHPNAGLPDALGHYSLTPEAMARAMQPLIDEGIVSIAGGCCGTTPAHIAALRRLLPR